MAKHQVYSFIACLLLGVIISAQAQSKPKTWCIVKNQASGNQCQPYLDRICSAGVDIDCSPAANPNGPCYQPNTICSHTSYALNIFWQRRRICDDQIATVTSVDPSYGNCKYPANEY